MLFSVTGSIESVNVVSLPSPLKVSTLVVFPVTTPPMAYAIIFVPFDGAVSNVSVVPLTLNASLF